MRISLTGRIALEANGARLYEGDLPGRQARLLLAYLVAEQGRGVPREELAEALWAEAPPPTWDKALAVLVSKLRAVLEECGVDGRAALTSEFGCYRLTLPEGAWVDVQAAAEAVVRAEAAAAAGELTEAREHAAAAASVARRAFLPGEYGTWVEEKRRELHELLVRSLECLADVGLRTGETRAAVEHAEELTSLEPYRESGYRSLMRAQAAGGNNAEALRVYERCRRLLADELGAFPSPETEATYLEILRSLPGNGAAGSAAVASAEHASKMRRRIPRRRLALLAAGTAAAAAAVAAAVLLTHEDGAELLPRIAANAVAAVDAQALRPRVQLVLPGRPAALAAGGGFLWVAGEDGSVSRVDLRSQAVRAADLGDSVGSLVFAAGSLWVTKPDERAVAQVDPERLAIVQTVAVGNGPAAIASGRGAIWVANALDGTVSRIDVATAAVRTVPVGERPTAITVGAGAVWVAKQGSPSVLRLDPQTAAVVGAVDAGEAPSALAANGGSVWVASRQDGTVSRIDPAREAVATTTRVGPSPVALAVRSGAVWVANAGDGTIARLAPGGGRIERSVSVESSPSALVLAGSTLWVATLPALGSHRGGVLRVAATPLPCPCGDPGGAGFNVPVTSLTHDGLVGYRRVAGVAGGELVPDLAVRLPTPTDGGRTYTFRLRRGVRYSNGTRLRASDFRSSLERMLAMNRGGQTPLDGIVGAATCLRAAARCDLSQGLEADDAEGRLTIRLVRADSDFLHKLVGLAAIPRGTPVQRGRERPVPGTGPYRVASVSPRAVRLTRNPWFRVWSPDARPDGYPDEIRFRFSDDPAARLAALRRGEADYANSLPATWLRRLLATYGNRVHVDPAPWVELMFLNVHVPPFDDLRVRRALNYAVDRGRIVELAGGALVARPACRLVPPTIPGYRPGCRYTLAPNAAGTWRAPDLARARALVAASGTRGTRVEVLAYEAGGRLERVAYARYFARLLERLGYHSSVRVIPSIPDYVDYVGDSRHRAQIGPIGWVVDAPSGLLRQLFACASFRPGDRLNRNLSEFCDPRIDAKMAEAAAVEASDPVRAKALWADADEALTAAAAAVPLIHRSAVVFVSKRVRNYQYHPQWGTLLDQLWVK